MREKAVDKERLIKERQSKTKELRRGFLLLRKEMESDWLGGSFSSIDVVTAPFSLLNGL